MTTTDEQIREAAEQWVRWDPDPATAAEVRRWLDEGDAAALRRAFDGRIAFGTAGLREDMAPGPKFMNDLVVLQTAQGLAAYLLEQLGEGYKQRGLALGFDHRARGSISSRRFAQITAAVFAAQGCRVFLLGELVATPLLAYTALAKNAAAAVMVTASHNPAISNGYKLYWGAPHAQIIPPHDSGVSAAIMANLEPWQEYDVDGVADHELVEDPLVEMRAAYLEAVTGALCRRRSDNPNAPRVVYTAMHGVGAPFVAEAFAAFGLPAVLPVAEQQEPDPTFATVAFPNPEEPGALNLAMATAEREGLSLVLANDPDADRLAVAERQADGSWHAFSGNEIGLILGCWEWACWREAHGADADASNVHMLASTVSSKALGAVAAAEGFHFHETLTGFKWLGNEAHRLRGEGGTALFAYEEAIGFCVGDVVLDKDGVSAAAVFAELAGKLAAEGLSVLDHLRQLEARYGIFVANNSYFKCYDKAVTNAIFDRIRTGNDGSYPAAVGGVPVARVRDLTANYDSGTPDNVPTLPAQSSHMITFTFEGGCVATLRTSGTEPKIKYYIEQAGVPGQPRAEVEAALAPFVEAFIAELLQPEENNLEPPPSG